MQTDSQRALPCIRGQKIYSGDKGDPIDFRKSHISRLISDYLEGFLSFSLCFDIEANRHYLPMKHVYDTLEVYNLLL